MEQPSQLPLLPSERKEIAERAAAIDDIPVLTSPARVSNLHLDASDEGSAQSPPDTNSTVSLNDAVESTVTLRREEEEGYRATRDEQIQQHFAQVRPLPVSTSSKKLLRFMRSTTTFVDSLAVKVDTRLTVISNHIGSIGTKVNILDNRLKEPSRNSDAESTNEEKR